MFAARIVMKHVGQCKRQRASTEVKARTAHVGKVYDGNLRREPAVMLACWIISLRTVGNVQRNPECWRVRY